MVIDVLMENLDFDEAEREALQLVVDIERAQAEGGRLYTTSASDPDFFRPHAVHRVGQSLLFKGRFREAIPVLEDAVLLDPELDAAFHDLAVALAKAGRSEDARHAVGKALELSPESSVSLMLSGILASRRGAFAEARNQIEKSVALNERSTIGRLELAWLLSTAPDSEVRDGVNAVELASEVSSRTGGQSARALDVLAAALAESGRFDEARATASQALALVRTAGGSDDRAAGVQLSTAVTDESSIMSRLRSYANEEPWRQPVRGEVRSAPALMP